MRTKSPPADAGEDARVTHKKSLHICRDAVRFRTLIEQGGPREETFRNFHY